MRPELTYVVAPAAPELRSVSLGNANNAGFSVVVTGFATSREVSSLQLTLGGTNLSTSQLTVDVANAFGAWYQSNQSAGFGSQFAATVTLAVDGNADDIDSISVTATNAQGASNSVSLDLSTQ